ncbi:flagellar hook-length control protein FliK [Herbaspirillum sp. GCM10030257]|uniref:flagellar hook-length control protein FliK n=1 Tax=Herbaspirillum sp. GCM10030257 TaxID=3273393 RepID=UPI0036206980
MMKTLAITNIGAPADSRSSEKSTAPSDVPFGQVLSREVQNRNAASKADNSRTSENKAGSAGQASQGASSADNSQTAAEPQNEIPPTPSKEGRAVDPAARSDDTALAQQKEDEAAITTAPADLLALVAELNQFIAGTAGVSADRPVEDRSLESNDSEDPLAKAAELLDEDTAAGMAGSPPAIEPVTVKSDPIVGVADKAMAAAPGLPAAAAALASKDAALLAGAGTTGTTVATPRDVAVPSTIDTQQATQTADSVSAAPDGRQDTPEFSGKFKDALGQFGERPVTQQRPEPTQTASAQADLTVPANTTTELRATTPVQDMPAAAPSFNMAPASQAQQSQLIHAAAIPGQENQLSPRVGSSGWDQALGQKVVWMVNGSQQSASLSLNPPDLGPLQVVLNVTNNEATAQFTAAQPEVRQALETAMPKLREMLSEAGIQLGEANVSAGTPNNQQGAHSERSPSERQGEERADTGELPMQTISRTIVTGRQGLVDTFA